MNVEEQIRGLTQRVAALEAEVVILRGEIEPGLHGRPLNPESAVMDSAPTADGPSDEE